MRVERTSVIQQQQQEQEEDDGWIHLCLSSLLNYSHLQGEPIGLMLWRHFPRKSPFNCKPSTGSALACRPGRRDIEHAGRLGQADAGRRQNL